MKKFNLNFENDAELQELIKNLNHHKIYSSIRTLDDLRIFMSNHVYAVWDFMSLVKRVQALVVPTRVPWMPPEIGNVAARSINEMVLSEESDYDPIKKRYTSHFELYLDAMREIRCTDWSIQDLLENVNRFGFNKAITLQKSNAATRFVEKTMNVALSGPAFEVVTWLTWGREKIIPKMFANLIDEMGLEQNQAPYFFFYVQRHIELDGEEHSELASHLMEAACGDDEKNWDAALVAAREAVRARIEFWDEVLHVIMDSRNLATGQPFDTVLNQGL